MSVFQITPSYRDGTGPFLVEAENHGAAARLAAHKIYPVLATQIRAGGYFVQRETGAPSGSGLFALWRALRGAGGLQSSYGRTFHVMER